MIADALRVEIERYARRIQWDSPLFVNAKQGTITREQVMRYLVNIKYLITHTPIHLVRARESARAAGDERLAQHFDSRLREEVGHDQWAEADLDSLGRVNAPAVTDGDVSSSMKTMVRQIEEIIDKDPALYLSYILFAEYVTVLVGPAWLHDLETYCGISPASMSVVANHAELDKDHTEEALENIDDLVGNPRKLPAMREALRASMDAFSRFAADMATTPIRHERGNAHAAA